MSDTGGIGLGGLGQGALRVARSLFAPDAAPACPSAYDGLLTDPAAHLNALFAPLTPFLRDTAAPSSRPPESDVEPRRDTLPAGERTRQAASGTEIKTDRRPGVIGWSGTRIETPISARTALRPASNAFTSSAAPAAFSIRPDVPPQETNGTENRESRVFPDALDALRALTMTARNPMNMPSAGGNNGNNSLYKGPYKPQTLPTSEPAASSFSPAHTRNADKNSNGREAGRPFMEALPLEAGGPFSMRQESVEPHGTGQSGRQAAPSAASRQIGEETAPLRMTQGASPLAAMLQTHVRPVPPDAVTLPAPPDVPNWPVAQADTPPGPLRPAPLASAVQASALTPHAVPDDPSNAAPPAAAPPDADALIQALEAHLELEFLRAYGTSGR